MAYKNPADRIAYDRRYYLKHRERSLARDARWRAENYQHMREQDNAAHRRSYEEDPGRRAEYHRLWYLANKGRISDQHRAYAQTHRTGGSARTARYDERKRHLPMGVSGEQWGAIKAAYGHRCAYCGRKSDRLEREHVTPVVSGGTLTPDNIVPACRSCNASKGTKPPTSIPPLRLLF